jgi:hypothetical protein
MDDGRRGVGQATSGLLRPPWAWLAPHDGSGVPKRLAREVGCLLSGLVV